MRKSADITENPSGKKIVEILSYGCIEYMLQQGIPVTAEGFEQLVSISRETGLNGRIAFQMSDWTQQKLQTLFAKQTGFPIRTQDGVAERLRGKRSIRQRLLAMGLGGEPDADANEREKLLSILENILGPGSKNLIDALRFGECQRDLVAERIAQIVAVGNLEEQLRVFREQE